MAELLLTDEEKAAPRWLGLDANTVGKVVLAGTSTFASLAAESENLRGWSAAILMIWHAFKTNASEVKIEVNGLTYRDEPMGDFTLTVCKAGETDPIDLLYRMARHIRNTDDIQPTAWGVEGMKLLAELQAHDPDRYEAEIKK